MDCMGRRAEAGRFSFSCTFSYLKKRVHELLVYDKTRHLRYFLPPLRAFLTFSFVGRYYFAQFCPKLPDTISWLATADIASFVALLFFEPAALRISYFVCEEKFRALRIS